MINPGQVPGNATLLSSTEGGFLGELKQTGAETDKDKTIPYSEPRI